jgi:hypothetical protein
MTGACDDRTGQPRPLAVKNQVLDTNYRVLIMGGN